MINYFKEKPKPLVSSYHFFFMAFTFIFFGSSLIICSLAPGSLIPSSQMSPDYLFCYIFFFLIRFPKTVPLLSILFLSLLADFLWYRPIGLSTLITLLTSEFMRWIISLRQKISFLEEFIYVTLILLFTIVIAEIIKFFTLIPSLSLNQLINHYSLTLMLYFATTFVIFVLSWLRR